MKSRTMALALIASLATAGVFAQDWPQWRGPNRDAKASDFNTPKTWRKDDFKAWPNFFPASSPMVVDGLVIAQLGGRDNGALVAYDLATGNEKWKWNGPSPTYASPVLMTVGSAKLILAQTESKLIAV